MSWDGPQRHVGHQQDAASVDHAARLGAECRGVGHQGVIAEPAIRELYADDDLVIGEQVTLQHRDLGLVAVHRGLRLDLHGEEGAVGESVYQAVDTSVDVGQEHVKAAARLVDQGCPDQELAFLADLVLTAGRPRAHRVWNVQSNTRSTNHSWLETS